MLAGAQWTLDASRGFQWCSDDKLCLKKAKFCERQSRAELALRSSMWRLVSTARIDHGSCKDPSWHLVASVSLQERWNSSSTATIDFGLSRMTGQQHMAEITTGACGDRSPCGEVAHLLRVDQRCSQVPSGLLMLPGASNGPLMTNFAAKFCERQSRAELALRSSIRPSCHIRGLGETPDAVAGSQASLLRKLLRQKANAPTLMTFTMWYLDAMTSMQRFGDTPNVDSKCKCPRNQLQWPLVGIPRVEKGRGASFCSRLQMHDSKCTTPRGNVPETSPRSDWQEFHSMKTVAGASIDSEGASPECGDLCPQRALIMAAARIQVGILLLL